MLTFKEVVNQRLCDVWGGGRGVLPRAFKKKKILLGLQTIKQL